MTFCLLVLAGKIEMDEVERIWMGGKVMLGPMVRASSLPLRLAALEYGADIVYSEEIPAHRAGHSSCVRHENLVLGTVDFIEKKSHARDTLVLFRTDIDKEVRPRTCVLQLGCSDSTTALKAARMFERDVAAIDINMGCSKHYSTSRGMGSALMSKPEVVEDIIKTLRRNISVPISVKTRLHSTACGGQIACGSEISAAGSGEVDMGRTQEWLQRLQMCGAQAITVHMRTAAEKYRDAAHSDLFGVLHQKMRCSHTPLVYNGDIWTMADMDRVQRSVGSHLTATIDDAERTESRPGLSAINDASVMVSRAGLWNPSVFRELKMKRNEKLTAAGTNQPMEYINADVSTNRKSAEISELLACIMKHSANSANCPLNTRYLLQQILAGAKRLHCDTRTEITRFYDLENIASTLTCAEEVREEKRRQANKWSDVTKTAASSAVLTDGTASDGTGPCTGSVKDVVEAGDLRDYAKEPTAQCSLGAGDDGAYVSPAAPHTAPAVGMAPPPAARPSFSRPQWQQFFNSPTWPGVISQTSHEYNDRYFDDNYYVAFNKPQAVVVSALQALSEQSAGGAKRGFSFSGFSDACTTIVRTKKKIS